MTSPHNNDNRDDYNNPNHDASWDNNPTEVFEPVRPENNNDTREYHQDNDFINNDNPETQQFYPVDDSQYHYDPNNGGYYDFSFENMVDEMKEENKFINLPSGHTYNNEWVSRVRYDKLYDDFNSATDSAKEIQGVLIKKLNDSNILSNSQATTISRLEDELNSAKRTGMSSENYNRLERDKLDNERRKVEDEKRKNKTKLIASWVIAGLSVLLAMILLFAWINAKNTSESESQKGTAHQEKISRLEANLKDSQNRANNLDSQNKDLQNKNDSLSKRANDAEKAVNDTSKDVQSKDEKIKQLQDDVKRLQESPTTVTSTATDTTTERAPARTSVTTITVPADRNSDDSSASETP